MKERIEGTKRVYYVSGEEGGLWYAEYQPRNPQTGAPWQARRGITEGWDAYQLSNWKIGHTTEILLGTPPADWTKEYTGCRRGFSTRDMALVAVQHQMVSDNAKANRATQTV